MKTAALPQTSLTPSVLCLGTADMGTRISREESLRLLDAFVDAGGSFIDTAEVYSDWVPGEKSRVEKLLGEWLHARGHRDKIVLATKGAHPRLESMHVPRLTRDHIIHDLHVSLQNLRTDVVDLYWLHRDAPAHPVGDLLETLNEQLKIGTIRAFGCSNWRVERIKEANLYARDHDLQGFVANQPLWNMASISQERLPDPTCAVMDGSMRRYHEATQLACVPWSAQANGYFQHSANGTLGRMNDAHQRLYGNLENPKRFERAMRLSRETGQTMTEIVIAYLRSHPFPVFPIIGCRNMAQLQDSVRTSDAQLTAEQVRFLETG